MLYNRLCVTVSKSCRGIILLFLLLFEALATGGFYFVIKSSPSLSAPAHRENAGVFI